MFALCNRTLFRQADYDTVAIKGNLNALDRTWSQVLADDPDRRLNQYRQFFDWYVRTYCVDLSDPKSRDARIRTLIERAI